MRAAVALIVAAAAACAPADAAPRVRTGLDVLSESGFAELRGLRVGLVLHRASVTRDGVRADRAMLAAGVDLVRLFTPEHGLDSDREGDVADGVERASGLPIQSLYGDTRRPPPESLADLDALVIDLQDAGARFYTYLSTMGECLVACAEARVVPWVLDRPNPLGGRLVEGPVSASADRSFVAWHPVPVRHGMTYGELARLLAADLRLPVGLRVVPLEGWTRAMRFEDTGLAWTPPSPNLPDPAACALYPGVALLELTNVSVGRGTDRPFRFVGAPWIDDAEGLAADLRRFGPLGFSATPAVRVPTRGPFAGEACAGVDLEVTQPDTVRAVDVGLALGWALARRFPDAWEPARVDTLLADEAVLRELLACEDPGSLGALWRAELDAFLARRALHLLYPDEDAP